MAIPFWSNKNLDDHFKSLGIKKGDNICVHSKLWAFGELENGVAGFYQALRRAVGEEGTLVLPSFTFGTSPYNVFSVKESKPEGMGSLPNYVWSLDNKFRSSCPIHSHMGIGPKAQLLKDINGLSSIGKDSDFEFFLKNNFNLLMLGLGFTEGASYMHYVEYCAKVPYRQPLSLPRKIQYTNDGKILDVNIYYYGRPDVEYLNEGKNRPYLENYDVVENKMIEEGLITQIKTSFGRSSYCSVANAHKCAMNLLEFDSYAMVIQNKN